jgi:hypothetical protein
MFPATSRCGKSWFVLEDHPDPPAMGRLVRDVHSVDDHRARRER